jgi:two-component sensor histidine kinase
MTRADASAGLTFERVLILAPRGRDAQLASVLLREIGRPAFICADIGSLCMELSEGAACALVAEEAMIRGNIDQLAAWVRTQPAWSDFPIVLLTGRGDSPERPILATQVQDLLGNISFLERPFHPTTLINITRSAVRSRHRQYEARDLLGRYELLARELQHRTKNLMSIIQSIASASLQEGDSRDAFFARLHALARAQDLLLEGGEKGALIKDIVSQALESFASRVITEGPEVFLNATTAQGFALILNELATNAAKHGALTTATGNVSVRWSIDVSPAGHVILFKWRERGGPVVKPPKDKGFGMILLERALPYHGGPPEFTYAPEGLTYELRTVLAMPRQRG